MNEYELEDVPAQEWEGSIEGEWEGEWESEWEGEWEGEWEDEWEDEFEADTEEFYGQIAALAQRAASSPALQRIGRAAADAAMRGLGAAVGQASGPPDRPNGRANGQPGGRRRSASASRLRGTMPPQREHEDEWEDEYEANPIHRAYSESLMEHLGHAAATARNEAEAEAFVGAMVPLATTLLPHAARAVARATPSLVRGLAGVARTLRSSPTTKPLVRTLPEIMRRTAANIARQSAQGQPVTSQTAVRTLAQQTAKVVGDPRNATQAYRRSRAAEQQHRR